MNKHWTEAEIRNVLDGTFTRVLYDGRIITENVGPDFIPTCAGGPKRARGENVKPHAFWTPEEDDLMWQMRIRNRPFAEIAWTLNRTEEATKKRWKIVRMKSGVVA